MKILIIGLTSSGLGGMEYHNLGNYIIMEPLIDELQKTFTECQIRTSIQMSDEYCQKWNIVSLKEKRFYTYGLYTGVKTFIDIFKIGFWKLFALSGLKLNFLLNSSSLLSEINNADLVIDFSGDIYGDNAFWTKFLESNAELIFARMLNKKIAMLIGSPGPFKSTWRQILAKSNLMNIDLLTNREAKSTEFLEYIGIKGNHIYSTACPSVLFQKEPEELMSEIYQKEGLDKDRNRPLVGLILCGWNMPVAPFNKWPREDWEYQSFIELIDYLISEKNVDVCVMSHQNGTDKDGNFIKQNDHKIIGRLLALIGNKYTQDRLFSLKGLYTAAESKAIIGKFDILVSGRVHGAVQGLSQCIPTAIIDYGHEPRAHKLKGFAEIYDVSENVMDPLNIEQMKLVISQTIDNKEQYAQKLQKRVPQVQELALKNFVLLKELSEK
ncbi:polysaccharide pyruvyl transferase family protein [Sulfurovum sp. XGS-02]|uniref:polysaccharide pyruvyl transferase family protein n=1 Tax=Sulfurovum sp. XGS-02 TaxID=2925411 RepID=UPI00206BBD97|nr:polysaccharide pyruvyl transferase family protein [Sulfurovum sp. XGS-02]UPT77637.1 polysaccharide pyruvyl transferase family protein [Sulfurovum sp. XGS-02]